VDIVYNSDATALNELGHVVYIRRQWGDPWEIAPELSCEQATWALGFDISTATLVREFGLIRLPGEQTHTIRNKVDLTGFFVLVEYQTHYGSPLFWLGFVERSDADSAAVSNGVLSGLQVYECFGLEKALDLAYCDTTVWTDGSVRRGNVDTVFNRKRQGNRSLVTATNAVTGLESYVFSGRQDESAYWTTRDIVQYLLAWHVPLSSTGVAAIAIGVVNLANVYALDLTPELNTAGRSVRDLLNALLHGNNLLTWYLRYTAPANIMTGTWIIDVVIVSLAPAAITLPSGATQPGAATIINLEVDADVMTATSLTDIGLEVADQIRVRGGRKSYIFTGYMCDTTATAPEASTKFLVSDWSDSDQGAYISAAVTEQGYADLTLDEKKQANGFEREKYPSVFADYRVNWRWDCVSHDDEHVFGTFEDEPVKVVPQELRLLPDVPLFVGVNYSGEPPFNESYQRLARFPYQPIKLWSYAVREQRLYDARGLAAKNAQNAVEGDTPFPEISISTDGDKISFVVRNAEQHTINNLASQGLLENRQSLHTRKIAAAQSLITVAVSVDSWCEGIYPVSPQAYRDVLRVHTLYAGDAYQHVTLTPGTILGVRHDGAPVTAEGGIVRDDSGALRDLARIVYEWMATPRKNLAVRSARIDGRWVIGALIGTTKEHVSTVSVNSPIARIQVQSPRAINSEPISPQMIVSTAMFVRDWQRVLDEFS
jgi:hypothetical protein